MEREFDQNVAYSFFRQHPLMTLTTVNDAGVPENAVVYVYMDEEMNCYCATRSTTRKYENVKNKHAVISTYDENVLMFGEVLCEAEVVEDSAESAKVLPELQKIVESRKAHYWIPPVSQLPGDGYVFIKLHPKKVTFVNYEQSTSENPKPHRVEFDV